MNYTNNLLKIMLFSLLSVIPHIKSFTSYSLLMDEEGKMVLLLSNSLENANLNSVSVDIKNANLWSKLIKDVNTPESIVGKATFIFDKLGHILKIWNPEKQSYLTIDDPICAEFNNLSNDKQSVIKYLTVNTRSNHTRIIHGIVSVCDACIKKYGNDAQQVWPIIEKLIKSSACTNKTDTTFTLREYISAVNENNQAIIKYRDKWPKLCNAYIYFEKLASEYSSNILKACTTTQDYNLNAPLKNVLIDLLDKSVKSNKFKQTLETIRISLLKNLNNKYIAINLLDNLLDCQQREFTTLVFTDQENNNILEQLLIDLGYKRVKSEKINTDSPDNVEKFISNLLQIQEVFLTATIMSVDVFNDQAIEDFKAKNNINN